MNRYIKGCERSCTPQTQPMRCEKAASTDVQCNFNGFDRFWSKKYMKGLAFPIEERQFLGIHGLLPPAVRTPELQMQRCMTRLSELKNPLDKFKFLMELAMQNQQLFFRLITSDLGIFLPLIHLPTLSVVCRNYGLVYDQPQGLFISIKDKGHIYDVLKNWPERTVKAVVVTDGERTMGHGDWGAYAMGISISCGIMLTALGGIKPRYVLPIMLDCGTNRDSLIIDPLYIGMREKRITGSRYDEFMDEFMNAVAKRFGPTCVYQFEGFFSQNAFRLLSKYNKRFCFINNDIQTTASSVLAGIFTTLKTTGQLLKEQKIVFYGVGTISLGIARLLRHAFIRHGVHGIVAKKSFWFFDSNPGPTYGLVVVPEGLNITMPRDTLEFAQVCKPMNDFIAVLNHVRPTILIGASGQPGSFTPEVLKCMAEFNERPIIFALSIPSDMAECTPRDAFTYTNGKCIYSGVAPSDPIFYKGKHFPGHFNNAAVYPGIVLGVMCSGMPYIPEDVFYIAAETLAEMTTYEESSKGLLFPSFKRIMCSSLEIARWVMEFAYRFGMATVIPEPKDKYEFLKTHLYDPEYQPLIPEVYVKEEIW